jgi:hypothetical protein
MKWALVLLGLILVGSFVLVPMLAALLLVEGGPQPPFGGIENRAVAAAAALLAGHLTGPRAQSYDDTIPLVVLHYWQQICPPASLCYQDWQPGNLQCVLFVLGAFALSGDPLPVSGNAIDFWALYRNRGGFREIPTGTDLPAPGDLMVWWDDPRAVGEPYGHVAIVLERTPPRAERPGSVTFAEANGPGAIVTEALLPDMTVLTWPHYRVLGYIRAQMSSTTGSVASSSLRDGSNPYVALAWADAEAAGIDPAIFVRQIEVESHFDPHAVSPAGAVGIAQFLPQTAAQLGVNPTDPVAALRGAARYMAELLRAYDGDEAKALAAYNAGPDAVAFAVRAGGAQWRHYLPQETQQYLAAILPGAPLVATSGG